MQNIVNSVWKAINDNTYLSIIFTTLFCLFLIKVSNYIFVYKGFASLIWPVTGINLALVLILGYRIWPGIFIASILSYTNINALSFEDLFDSYSDITTIILSLNNVLHAILGAWLVRYFKCFPNDFSVPSKILKFYLIAGPLPAILGSTVGSVTWLYNGFIQPDLFLQKWFTWWLADVGSVFIFTTLIIAAVLFKRNRKLIVTFISVAAFLIAYSTYLIGQMWDKDRLDLLFEQKLVGIEDTIVDSNEIYRTVLYMMNGFVKNPNGISPKSFKRFSQSVLPYNPSIRSVNWKQAVTYDELENFQQDLFNDYGKKIELLEVSNGAIVPIDKRDEYVFVRYFQSPDDDAFDFNIDLFKNRVRKDAFIFAIESKLPSLTAPMRVPDLQEGVVIPIYLANFNGDELLGFSTVVVDMKLTLADILTTPFAENLELTVYDALAEPGSQILFQTTPDLSISNVDIQTEITLFNRNWTIAITKKQSFYDLNKSLQPIFIGIAGMVIASLIAVGIVIVTGQGLFLEVLVKSRTVALEKANDELEKANNTKSEFMANMSHDLRTPLNAIIGFSEIMNKQMFGAIGSEKYKNYIEDIHSSSHYLLALVNDILDLSTLEADKRILNKESIDPRKLIENCVRSLEPLSRVKKLEITIEVKSEIKSIFADISALKQILINLISNSIKFTSIGGIINIHADCSPKYIIINVVDNGVGIANKDIENILQPFAQVNNDPLLKNEGTGLGLSIVSSLVKLHGGKLNIKSELTKGTTVIVNIPIENNI